MKNSQNPNQENNSTNTEIVKENQLYYPIESNRETFENLGYIF